MNVPTGITATVVASPPAAMARVVSIDITRGLTMAVMIFVNELAGVRALPWWTYHMPGNANGMTYVDVVFPAFLFILGMAIPLAVRKRERAGDSTFQLWRHVLIRSLSLVVLGVLLANIGYVSARLTGMGSSAWGLCGLVGAVLLWGAYPRTGERRALYSGLKAGGFVLLAFAFAIFRRELPDGRAAWLDFSYWEILGLIGRAYLAACILYISLRKYPWAPFALLTALTALSVASRLGWAPFLRAIPYWAWPLDAGELPSVVMAGVVTAAIMLDLDKRRTFARKVALTLGFASLLFAAGWLLMPLGISKVMATPTWCLYSSGISVLLFLAVYWLADVRGNTSWAAFVRPAGANTLLTYLLPYFLGLSGLTLAWTGMNAGWPGVLRAALFTAFVLVVSWRLTARRIAMQL